MSSLTVTVEEVPLPPPLIDHVAQPSLFDPPTVSVVLDADGNLYDACYNVASGRNYALNGYRVRAVADDGAVSVGAAQLAYDADLAAYRDCYGVG